MDTTKQNPLPGAQESDDLIAELARLVAQDARSQSVNSAAYTRPEPELAPEPEPEPEQEPQELAPESAIAGDYGHDPVPGERTEPEFSFNFPRSEPAPSYTGEQEFAADPEPEYAAPGNDDEHDLIADLIASADSDRFESDDEQQESDYFDVYPSSDHQPAVMAANMQQNDTVNDEPQFYAEPEPESEDFAPEAYFARIDHPSQNTVSVSAERDPLREIEALIGEAARVSVDAGAQDGRRVRSSFLDTSDYEDIRAERAVDAAESAILAAAAAGGASVSHISADRSDTRPDREEQPYVSDDVAAPEMRMAADEPDFAELESEEPPVRQRRRLGLLVPAAAGAIVVAALLGGYIMFLAPNSGPSEAPILTADAGELKEVPDTVAAPTTASESVIFNEIDGNTVAPEDEVLVSRDQTDGATGAAVGQVIAPEEGEVGLANRPVRTVTVRPDGTIVTSDNSIAGSSVLPVERPDVPAVPNSTLTSDPIGEAIAAAISDELPSTDLAQTAPAAEPEPANPPATTAADNPIVDPATIPRPIPRPAGLGSAAPSQPVTQVATAPEQTITTPASTPAPAPSSATPGNVGAWVQLSSQRSEEAARADIPSLQSRYGVLFGGTPLDVNRVDLGDRGIYYRVRLPQPNMTAASSVCDAIKGQGGDCFVLNNN